MKYKLLLFTDCEWNSLGIYDMNDSSDVQAMCEAAHLVGYHLESYDRNIKVERVSED